MSRLSFLGLPPLRACTLQPSVLKNSKVYPAHLPRLPLCFLWAACRGLTPLSPTALGGSLSGVSHNNDSGSNNNEPSAPSGASPFPCGRLNLPDDPVGKENLGLRFDVGPIIALITISLIVQLN